MMDFETAWSLYRRAETRLPPRPPTTDPVEVAGLVPLLDRYDAFVLDAWGVLNLGESPIPSARGAFEALRRTGKPFVVLSNDASSDPEDGAARHTRRGFPVTRAQMVYGVDLVPEALAAAGHAAGRCALVADPDPPRVVAQMGLRPVEEVHDPDALVVLSTTHLKDHTRETVERLLAARPLPVFVGNPDIVSPEPSGMAVEPGYLAHHWAERLGARVHFLGKPFPATYARALERLGQPDPSRVLCVGDTPHTDVLGGRAAGCATLLVGSGFLRGQDARQRCLESGLTPDYLAASL
jgi:HAD superfamily hydrolase (TIGR01450 family)